MTRIVDQCHACHSFDASVLDSRRTGIVIRRRRQCAACGARWTTYELRADFLRCFYEQGRAFFAALPSVHDDASKKGLEYWQPKSHIPRPAGTRSRSRVRQDNG